MPGSSSPVSTHWSGFFLYLWIISSTVRDSDGFCEPHDVRAPKKITMQNKITLILNIFPVKRSVNVIFTLLIKTLQRPEIQPAEVIMLSIDPGIQ